MDAVTADCAALRVMLGAYVLGALEAGERAQLEAHLAECPRCRNELVSLAALPGLLARVDPTVLDSSIDPAGPARVTSSELLAQRAIGELRGRRRRYRNWAVGVAVAALVVGVIAGATEIRQLTTDSRTVTASDAASHVKVQVRMKSRNSGTAMSVRVTGAGGEERCSLVAVAVDGRRETAATWEADYGGGASADGQTALPLRDIAALEIVTLDGRRLVRVPV